MNRHRSLLNPPLAAVMSINASLLVAAGAGFLAWAGWHPWQAALASGLLAIMAVSAFMQAAALAFKIYCREREIAAMLASGRTQHPADLASASDMRRAGMTDD